MREALKRLQEAAFVERGARRRHPGARTCGARPGLDLLAHLAVSEGRHGGTGDLLRDGLEMRRCVGVEAARLAALRADDDARERIAAAASAYRAQQGPGGEHGRPQLLGRGGRRQRQPGLPDGVQLRSLHAIDVQPELMGALLHDDRADTLPHADLAPAIVAGDADRAGELADAILVQALDALTARDGSREPRGA